MALTDNLVSYWKLDESSGNAADSVGSNTLTNVNTTFGTGKINNGAIFDADTDSLSILDASQTGLDITGAFSFATWVKFDSIPTGGNYAPFVNKYLAAGNQRSYQFLLYGDGNLYSTFTANGSTGFGNTYAWVPTTGVWYHLAVTYTPSTNTKIYINGELVNTNTTSIGASIYDGTAPFYLGSDGVEAGRMTQDESAIWSRTLSIEEVKQLYNAGAANAYPLTNPTIIYLQNTGSGTDLSTYTFSSQNLGPATSDRRIIAAVNGRTADGTSSGSVITSVTIGGVSATVVNQVQNTGNTQGIAIAEVPSGTTGDVVVVFNETMTTADIALYATTGINTTATDSGTSTASPLTYALDIAAGGVAVAAAISDNGAATATWAGLTEVYDDATVGGNDKSGAFGLFATTQTNLTVSCTWSGSTRPVFATASFPIIASSPSPSISSSISPSPSPSISSSISPSPSPSISSSPSPSISSSPSPSISSSPSPSISSSISPSPSTSTSPSPSESSSISSSPSPSPSTSTSPSPSISSSISPSPSPSISSSISPSPSTSTSPSPSISSSPSPSPSPSISSSPSSSPSPSPSSSISSSPSASISSSTSSSPSPSAAVVWVPTDKASTPTWTPTDKGIV